MGDADDAEDFDELYKALLKYASIPLVAAPRVAVGKYPRLLVPRRAEVHPGRRGDNGI